jgi:hypothetical protein
MNPNLQATELKLEEQNSTCEMALTIFGSVHM